MVKAKKIPLRSCAACGQRLSKRDLVRIVHTLDDKIEVDSTGKKPGRGTYLCSKGECWDKGLKRNRLEHALRLSSRISEGDKEALLTYSKERLSRIGSLRG